MTTTILANMDKMMTAARLLPDGVAVTFADGCAGVVPFTAMPDVADPASVTGLSLPNPYELYLVADDGEHPEIPWDFARHYCDATYRQRVEAQALLGRHTLGSRIRQYRKAAGLTQEGLARAAGIGRVTLVRIERGEQVAKLKTLAMIAQALGRPIAEMLGAEEWQSQTTLGEELQLRDEPTRLESIEMWMMVEHARRHEAELGLMDQIFSEIMQVLGGLSTEADSDQEFDQQESRRLLSARVLLGLRSARILFQYGFYEQAMTLIRSSKEHLLIAYDIEICPETISALKKGSRFNVGNLLYSDMADRVEKSRNLQGFKRTWMNIYRELNEYVHPGGARRQQIGIPGKEKSYVIPIASYYNPELASMTLFFIKGELLQFMLMVRGMATVGGSDWDAEALYDALGSSYKANVQAT